MASYTARKKTTITYQFVVPVPAPLEEVFKAVVAARQTWAQVNGAADILTADPFISVIPDDEGIIVQFVDDQFTQRAA